ELHPTIPVIGMEPAVKPAVGATGPDKRVLVVATELTLREEKFHHLVARVDTHQRVDYLPLQELVAWAERFEFSDDVIVPYLRQKLGAFDLDAYGAIVLGCTHFIFFKKAFREVLPAHVQILDGNRGTINNLVNQLKRPAEHGDTAVRWFISGRPAEASYFQKYLDLLKD
ncbi:MAG TPA: aspartate/glutamate racemase family protein, partial [Saprospiraceae bacterium]|nr:aspartate/glutamate racemase family protein [Saprospiraceae bacterium]